MSTLNANYETSVPVQALPKRLNLKYLDGVRGLGALYLVLYHMWQFVVTRSDFAGLPRFFRMLHLLKYGHDVTCIFIVLSGYCLMLPVVRSAGQGLSGGVKGFFLRRAQRILPAYYAALVFSVLLILAFPMLQHFSGTQWDFAVPALTRASLFSHLLLIHNLFVPVQLKLDPPMWSVALECQIYVVFALVLLPVWKRFGTLSMLFVAFLIGLLPLCCGARYLDSWFVGLFALGMTGAIINFSPAFSLPNLVRRASWGRISRALWILVLVCTVMRLGQHSPWLDILIGLATMTSIILCTNRLNAEPRSERRATLLEMRGPVTLGAFSYSLCLVHYPLIALFNAILIHAHLSTAAIVLVLFGAGVPLIVAGAYGFHCLFERPYLQRRPGTRALPVTAAQTVLVVPTVRLRMVSGAVSP